MARKCVIEEMDDHVEVCFYESNRQHAHCYKFDDWEDAFEALPNLEEV